MIKYIYVVYIILEIFSCDFCEKDVVFIVYFGDN